MPSGKRRTSEPRKKHRNGSQPSRPTNVATRKSNAATRKRSRKLAWCCHFCTARTYRVTPVLDFPAAAADEVTAIKNRRLANQWLEEFHATDDYRQVVQLKAQCVESRKEAQNIELEIAKLEEEHRASLARGGEVAKVEGNLGAARSKLSVLKSRVQTLASLSADAEKAARQKYGEFIALKKRAALVETQAVFEKLSTEWRTRMREGLLELVAVHQTLASMTTTYGPFQAEIAKPLTFPG